jgi:hypothetical protein
LDTNAPSALDKDIVLLFLNNRDRALGLPRPGAKTMSLLSYRQKRQQQALDMLAQAAFYKSLIDECRSQVEALIAAAGTPEARREILPEAQRLNALATEAAQALEQMSDG